MRDVTITTVLNGWVVTVGCQRVVFVDKNIMLDEISKYLDSPYETEKRYREEAINAKHAFKDVVAEEDESDVARTFLAPGDERAGYSKWARHLE